MVIYECTECGKLFNGKDVVLRACGYGLICRCKDCYAKKMASGGIFDKFDEEYQKRILKKIKELK